jgi:hypothetical protein
VPLHDPEYTPGASGSIKWTIEKLNGTKDEPNTELLMESPAVKIGDYDFRLKLYPNSVDESRYLSIFVSCDTMANPKSNKSDKLDSKNKKKRKSKDTPPVEESAASSSSPVEDTKQEWQHTPLPLFDPKRIPKRPSVAAQFSIIMYNPEEPRSNYHMTFSHRFCPGASDHGTKHFGFSKADAAIRRRGHRQAIYRNDKLAFVAHIRLVNDDTGCLWERSSRENPYDSLMITGLQGISSGTFGISGGNVISAISTWLLLMPFRQLLYEAEAPNPMTESRQRPKPMLLALQKILYCLRTRPEGVGNGPFALEDLLDAFDWYSLDKNTDKYDTIEIWEILRSKLEEELKDTPFASRLTQLFGPMRNRSTGLPCYRVPVRGSETMQKAINKTDDLVDVNSDPPQILTIELERYIFDEKQRTWQKLSEKLMLDETVVVCGQEYKLFGFVVHKESAQSGYYHSVLRPDGPGGKWYMYTDSRDENKVMCLTRKAAIDAHEGTDPKRPNNEQASVAYVVTYVRADIAERSFNIGNEPEWPVQEWLAEEVKREREMERELACNNAFEVTTNGAVKAADGESADKNDQAKKEVLSYEFSVISSQAFQDHDGPGIIDLYDPKWDSSEHILKVSLKGDANAVEARNQVAASAPNVKDPRQCKFWIVGSPEGTMLRPSLITTGKKEISGGSTEFDIDWTVEELVPRAPERRLWLHIIDEKDLPLLPPPAEEEKDASTSTTMAPSNHNANAATDNITDLEAVLFPPARPAATEDQHMAGTQDEPAPTEPAPDPSMPLIPPMPATDSSPLALNADTDMGDFSALPPMPTSLPVPTALQFDLAHGMPIPAPIPATPRADDIYFFLKTFDSKTQTLKAHGSYFVNRKSRVDHAVYKILEVSKEEKTLQLYEEDDIGSARLLRRRRNFIEEELTNGSIIIAQNGLSDEEKEELASQGIFTDPNAYLRALAEERSFLDTANGKFRMDYFSAEYYEGEMRYHMPHGQGKKIYHNSNSYTGTFVLGKRHGQGSMIFANGDMYEGDWVNGLQHGKGTSVELETGNKYEGGWKNGKKHGEGVTHWKMAQNEQRACKICWEEEAEAVFVDCGHVVACMGCARQVRDCPVCRRGVSKAVKLYFVA